MDRREELISLARRAYQASVDSAKWPLFLERASAFFGGSVTGFQHYGSDPGSTRADFVGIDPAHYAAYRSHYAAVNPWTKCGHRLYEPGRVLASDSFVHFSDLRRTEFYNDFLRDVGIAHAFGACLFQRGEVISNLTVTRSQAHGAFQERELALARVLLPHMRQAIEIHERLGDLQTAYGASADALDRLSHGVIVVDGHGRVLFVNRAAREIVIARDGLAIVGGVLEAEQVSVRLKLRVLIGRSIRSAAGDSLKAAGALRVSRPSMRRPYAVLVTPLRLTAAERTAPGMATILVSDPEREMEADATAVQTAYGLSRAEARVAGAIAADESVRRAADRLCLSVDTVRWHLKRIYRKTDTNRQAELVKLVLNTSIR